MSKLNADPRKEVIALGQTYFAIQTYQPYQQEVADRFNQHDEENKHLVIRGDIKNGVRVITANQVF